MSDTPDYVRMDDLKPGDVVVVDSGFTCVEAGAERIVQLDDLDRLFIACDHGQHCLDGQLGYTRRTRGLLVGITRKAA